MLYLASLIALVVFLISLIALAGGFQFTPTMMAGSICGLALAMLIDSGITFWRYQDRRP